MSGHPVRATPGAWIYKTAWQLPFRAGRGRERLVAVTRERSDRFPRKMAGGLRLCLLEGVMLVLLLWSLGLTAEAKRPVEPDSEVCRIAIAFLERAVVYNVKLHSCPAELRDDLEFRGRQVPWNLVIPDLLRSIGRSEGGAEDWKLVLRVAIPPNVPATKLPARGLGTPADPLSVPLSDRFTAPMADRRIQLLSVDLVPPPRMPSRSGYSSNAYAISVYNRQRALRRDEKQPGSTLHTWCTPWFVFSEHGKPESLTTHLPGACTVLPAAFIEPMLWRWTPPQWDGAPLRVGVPIVHQRVGEFGVRSTERFAPFYVGDTLVNDVPYSLKAAPGDLPQVIPAIEVPRVQPELLEERLGIEDASRIVCSVHLWTAPERSTPYALSVRECPAFFANIVANAYESISVSPPDRATEFVESVVFAYDDDAATWKISRR